MTRRILSAAVSTALALGLAGLGSPVQASGFSVPELSAAGLSLSNALVANPEELGAIPYNAAAMGFQDKSSLSLGALFINFNLSVDTASGSHDSQSPDWVIPPLFQAVAKINDQWRVGLGVTAPFGLETRWEPGTFPALSGTTVRRLPPPLGPTPLPNGNQPLQSKLQVLDFAPTASYKVNENLSVSAGLDYYWAKEAVLNSSLAEIEGDGSGWGWNLGVMFRKDAWSLGASYRSASTVAIDGTYSPLNQTLVMIGRLAPGQAAELDLNLPWRLQLGVRYAINPQLAVEVDWTRMGWSEFQKIEVQGKSTGQSIFTDTNDWEDADAIRVGLTYDVRPTTQLRLGYSYDETGQPDAHFSARVPDKDRQLFSIGVAENLAHDITVELGYMYVLTEDRDYVGVTPFAGQPDINGTTAINGNYKGDVNLFAIEVSTSF
jgi:long-chain fatty acid transport protein